MAIITKIEKSNNYTLRGSLTFAKLNIMIILIMAQSMFAYKHLEVMTVSSQVIHLDKNTDNQRIEYLKTSFDL